MAFNATVYRILIASPGDVGAERELISEVIYEWNALQSCRQNIVILPVKWETHSAPMLGDRPQEIINQQLVLDCDLLVGLFWTRIGTHTGASESGTVEEIESFIKQGRPVMLYFSSKPIDPTKINIPQYQKLDEFKTKMRPLGLIESYENESDFKEKFFRQLTINMQSIVDGKNINVLSDFEQEERKKVVEKIVKADSIFIEDYEKDGKTKSFLVKGDTKNIKDQLQALGGKWNRSLGGWIFPVSRKIEIAEFIKTHA